MSPLRGSWDDDAVKVSDRLACIEHELEERNKIERAKLAEMRAARILAAFEVGCLAKDKGLGALLDGTLSRFQDIADNLTAEVLGEEVKS